MSEKERLGILKRRLVQLEEKAAKLTNDRGLLSGMLDESNSGTNAKLSNLLDGADLKEEISYLNDWIRFYEEKSARYRGKIQLLEKAPEQEQEAGREAKLWEPALETELHRKKWPKKEFFKEVISKKPLIIYAIPFFVILLAIAGLLLLKPSITGHVALDRETAYSENLNLNINESGEYNWTLKNPGSIKSIKARGSVTGNGTVKIYIEKNSERRLIYKNK